MATGFFHDERCFWHAGGHYAGLFPVRGLVQPPVAGGLPESPESKRRLLNLLTVTGLARELTMASAPAATDEDLRRVHPESYLCAFRALSDAGGGELGPRAPFLSGGYEIAALSAGLACAAVEAVMAGRLSNAYALSRPPGHHCLPERPNGFCLLANIAIALRAAQVRDPGLRVAVLDWDVHHGNGTEAIFIADPSVLTVSLHQDRNYPIDTGGFDVRGEGAGAGFNLNIPLPPGTGHAGYLAAMERLALPAIRAFAPDLIVVACGFDAGLNDPLGRMMATAETFATMTAQVMQLAADVCGGRVVMVHEGGYSETYVPFCGHAVIQTLSGSAIAAPDPAAVFHARRQPGAAFDAFVLGQIDAMAAALAAGA